MPDLMRLEVAGPPTSADEIISICPPVGRILSDARAYRRCGRRVRWRVYEAAKRRLSRLIGWHAPDSRLASPAAYELALAALVEAMGL